MPVSLPFLIPSEQVGGGVVQVPAVHIWPVVHLMLQPPQLLTSLFELTSQPSAGLLLQSLKPELQDWMAQAPDRQAAVSLLVVQTWPQAPQLLVSVASFTQVLLLHNTCPAGQEAAQTPLVQVPLEHCAADVHAPPTDASPQPPSMQGVPLVQAVPQAPQFEGSAEVVVQNPLQEVPEQTLSVSPAACILYSMRRLASAPVFVAQVEPVRREACNTSPTAKVITIAPVSDQFWAGLRTNSCPLLPLVRRKTAAGQAAPVAVFATAAMRRTVIA